MLSGRRYAEPTGGTTVEFPLDFLDAMKTNSVPSSSEEISAVTLTPTELVEAVLFDSEVVGDFVDHRHRHLDVACPTPPLHPWDNSLGVAAPIRPRRRRISSPRFLSTTCGVQSPTSHFKPPVDV